MRRGEIWTAAGAGIGSKPRPVLVVQDDALTASEIETVLVVPLTSRGADAPLTRPKIAPDNKNGLHHESYATVDKTMPIRKNNFAEYVGVVSQNAATEIGQALALVLGFASA